MKQKTFVALYRVSTGKQAVSTLGLKAQRQAVRSYVKSVNGVLLE